MMPHISASVRSGCRDTARVEAMCIQVTIRHHSRRWAFAFELLGQVARELLHRGLDYHSEMIGADPNYIQFARQSTPEDQWIAEPGIKHRCEIEGYCGVEWNRTVTIIR